MTRKVIVDVDAGSDDAVALLLLLTFQQEKHFQVIGVTCTHGNTSLNNVCKNVLLTLESINHLHVPVYLGAESSLISSADPNVKSFHGEDGFGNNFFSPPKGEPQKENAVNALYSMALEHKDVSLICLGPLTNIALAIRTYSDFVSIVKEVYIMGGNIKGIGNTTAAAEFNFYKDPEAAHIVLSSFSCPITVLPWETCIDPDFTMEERLTKVGVIPRAHIRMLNKIDANVFAGAKYWNPCDAFLAACFLEKDIIKKCRKVNLTVELQGQHTRGQAILDHLYIKEANVKIIDELDLNIFKKLIYKMALYEPQ